MASENYGPLTGKDDPRLETIVGIESDAFGSSRDDTREWLGEAGADMTRVWEEDGRVCGALVFYSMAHFFGGRSVPTWGVAGVGIDVAARGRGIGTRLMQSGVREMHEKGVALSSLYPATQTVYRRAGYERAGNLYIVKALLEKIRPVDRTAAMREGIADDEPRLEALERERARRHDGNCDRTPMMWRRARGSGDNAMRVHLVEEDERVTGYIRWRFVDKDKERRVYASDVVASTAGAARRLLAFLADQAYQVGHAVWRGHSSEAVQRAAESLCFETKIGDTWMLRLAHLKNALTSRGYPAGVTAEVHLDVDDDLCAGNAGRWVLRVEDGTGMVERGGDGRIRLHVRELASIYSGHAHPATVAVAQPVIGSDADLATLATVFAGRDPWLQDAF